MGKRFEVTLIKEDIKIANKHVKVINTINH